jgi:nicotinate-nucleotide adenylyltransferase
MIALYGGSFDPVHIGHLRIAEDIREEYSFSKVVFIPAYRSPLKPGSRASAKDRIKMLQIALKDNPFFSIDDIEIKRGGKSFTIDTVQYYREKLNYNPVFILGTDAFLSLHKWKKPKTLLKTANFLVVGRGSDHFYNLKDYIQEYFPNIEISTSKKIDTSKTKVYFFNSRRLDISSTEIRDRIKEKKSIKYLVIPEIEDYIIKNKLYVRG